MAIRKSKEEDFEVSGNIIEWKEKIKVALAKGGFTSINENSVLNQITANYKKFTVWGEIWITLIENNNKVKIHVTSSANYDNIYTLFRSPNKLILDQFKNNL